MRSSFHELATAFNKNSFEEILEGDFSRVRHLDVVFFDGATKTIGEFYEKTHQHLIRHYKNEYIYKNAIARKIVIGKHKLSNIAFFNEFKVWSNYVDALVVNGCITAYEIKSEYDSYSRLFQQLKTYSQVFEFVNIVIPEKKYTETMVESLPNNIGVLVLSGRNSLSEKRKARSNLSELSGEMIFSCLHKVEYETFIIEKFGALPNVKPVYLRSECLKVFKTVDIKEINCFFCKVLKNRKLINFSKSDIEKIPYSMSGLILNYEIKNVEKIIKLTNTQLY
jgi:hypothetical protein